GDREPVRKSDRRVAAAANLERQHRARARHLTASDLMSRVRREPGIVHSLDALVVREKLGDATRVASLRAYAPGQRSNTAQREPALEGRRHGATPLLDSTRLGEERVFLVARDERAAEDVAVPAEILGGRVHNDIGAEIERTLKHRSGPGVVDNQPGAGLLGDTR